MKKRIIISLIIFLAVSLILFVPLPTGNLDDGGTTIYSALTYTIVNWKRYETEIDENGNMVGVEMYENTSVYWFPDNMKSISELWEIERQSN